MRFIRLSLAFAGIFLALSCGSGGAADTPPSSAMKNGSVGTTPAAAAADVDVVYYFMTAQRCPSCMKIEAYTKEVVERDFGDALGKGRMVWRMVNVDTPENNHFVKDYGLYTKSVVLVKIRGGKQVGWKNLDKVWTLLGNKDAFQKYIAEEMKEFVGKT